MYVFFLRSSWQIRAKVEASKGDQTSVNDKRYMKVTLNDGSGSIDCLAYDSDVDKFGQILKKGEVKF